MNDEGRMSKLEGMTKSEGRVIGADFFIIRALSLFRHSSFVIRHFP